MAWSPSRRDVPVFFLKGCGWLSDVSGWPLYQDEWELTLYTSRSLFSMSNAVQHCPEISVKARLSSYF
jgi:hypothetical protein